MLCEAKMNLKNFMLLQAIMSYTCSKFWESYMAPAAQIRVNVAYSTPHPRRLVKNAD